MNFSDFISGLGRIPAAIFPNDPNTQGLVDPSMAQGAQNQGMINLGLGIMRAPYDPRGLGSGILGAYQGAQADYQGVMDTALKHSLIKRDADYQQQERANQLKLQGLQLKASQRGEREQAAQTAQRVLAGLSNPQYAQNPQGYLSAVQNSPEFRDALQSLNVSPPTGTDQAQLEQFRQQLTSAAQVAAPAAQPIKLGEGDVLLSPSTYQPLASVAKKENAEVVHRNVGGDMTQDYVFDKSRYDPANPDAAFVKVGNPYKTTSQEKQGQSDFTGPQQALMAALDSAGVQLQGGSRSPAIIKARLQALIDRNPGVTPDQIAQLVRTGQLDYNGAKRSTGQLATAAATANAASLQLEKNFASMEPLVARMDVTGRPIIDRAFAQIRQNWKSGGDKDTAAFMTYLRAVAGEYAKIKSGGTGAAAPAEGEMKDAMDLMSNAFSQGGYQGMKQAILQEAANKRTSYTEGIQAAARVSTRPMPATVPPVAGADGKPLW